MWDLGYLKRLDFRVIPILFSLMGISLLVISSNTLPWSFSPFVKNQLRAFVLGTIGYLCMAAWDYRKLKNITWVLYVGMMLLLVGLFFVSPIHNVRRWYRLPFVPFDFQPSEYAKLIVILALGYYLERRKHCAEKMTTFVGACSIVAVPFLLIVKQPDLGTALVLCPITLVMLYFGNVHYKIIRAITLVCVGILSFVLLIFLGVFSHDAMKEPLTHVMKEYQYERLNPYSYHGQAGQTAIALGGYFGCGYGKSEFTGHQWLPYAFTDSVFPAFAEEFGMVGGVFLLALFFCLVYLSFQVMTVAKDPFGKYLAAGIGTYVAVHVMMNVGMMCGFLPITGVPLILISYGGSSVLSTMIALGILQSIYTHRFTF